METDVLFYGDGWGKAVPAMKPVSPEALRSLAGRFGFAPEALRQMGGGQESSDGVCYCGQGEGGPVVLKILSPDAADPDALERIAARAAFFAYLGAHGLDVVRPLESQRGNLIEALWVGPVAYAAYAYPMLTGEHPRPRHWSQELLQSWGAVLGRAHRLTKAYPIWQGVPSAATGKVLLTWQAEWAGFLDWCKDEEVKEVWRGLRGRIEALPCNRDTHGFLHNDPHMENILMEGGTVKLLDFDVASCQFFACDLAIAIQSVLFAWSGGMERPLAEPAALARFTRNLLLGYGRENDLDAQSLESIELYIAYRRALLFCVTQDSLAKRPEERARWKGLILREPRLLTRDCFP